MAFNREIRTTRIEDWEGNIYKIEGTGDGNGGAGGKYLGAEDINPEENWGGEGNTDNSKGNITDGSQTADPEANSGLAIVVTSDPEKDKNMSTAYFDDMRFGLWAVSMRVKCNNVSTPDGDILKVNVYYVDNTEENEQQLLSTTSVKARYFGTANKYGEVGFVTDFRGIYTSSISMKIEIILLKNTDITVYLDNITVEKAFSALTGTPTSISIIT